MKRREIMSVYIGRKPDATAALRGTALPGGEAGEAPGGDSGKTSGGSRMLLAPVATELRPVELVN